MDGEVPFTNLLGCNHHWPLCPALTLTRLTVTGLTLISIIMRNLINLFPLTPACDVDLDRVARVVGVELDEPARPEPPLPAG
jgi:hypothetical protein